MPRVRKKRKPSSITLPARPSEEQMRSLTRYLDRIYYDVASGGSYSSPTKLLQEVKRRGYYTNLGLKRIQNYLNKQKAYTLYKPARSRFPTPPVHVSKINQQFDLDLMDVSRQSSDNDGVRYILVAIDIMSKVLYAEPLKFKDAREVTEAASRIFDQQKPESVSSDLGSEFRARIFQDELKRCGIRHFFAGGSGKAVTVERAIRTLRGRIARYQYKQNTSRYIDALPDIILAYNKSFHRSIGMRPIDASKEQEHILYENLYGRRKVRKDVPFQFALGDSVRIAGEKHPFRREFFQRWTEEIFQVSKRWRQRHINLYKIKDCSGEELQGSFYPAELAKVTESPDELRNIERVLDEKVENGKRMVKVKWQGFPTKCAEWVLKNSIRTIR